MEPIKNIPAKELVPGITGYYGHGMYHVIGSNVPHSAVSITDCKVIDAFNPVREDYKPAR